MQRVLGSLMFIVLIVSLLAGCLGQGPDDDVPEPPPSNQRGNERLPLEDLPGGAPEAWNATLEAAPEWRLGQWWDVLVTDGFTGDEYEATVVVAGAEADWFLTGMPSDEFDHGLMVLHIPGIGQVRKADLAWEIHDALFQPVQFPLREDDTWETEWQAAPVTARVFEVAGERATVHILQVQPADPVTGEEAQESLVLELVYDASMGTIAEMDIPGYARLDVVDYGFEHGGVVTVPHEHALVFFSARAGGAVSFDYNEPGAGLPIDTVTVDADYDRVSFALITLSLAGSAVPVSPGAFLARATAPDGTEFELTMAPPEGHIKLSIHSYTDPGGDWELLMVAGGAGLVIIEGIAYHVFDIDTATGCLLDADEHAHHGAGTEHPDVC